MYGELRLEMNTSYGLLCCKVINVMSRGTNEIILRCMIDLQNCEKQLYWNMELYPVFMRVIL